MAACMGIRFGHEFLLAHRNVLQRQLDRRRNEPHQLRDMRAFHFG